jgi:hypothetical protein
MAPGLEDGIFSYLVLMNVLPLRPTVGFIQMQPGY